MGFGMILPAETQGSFVLAVLCFRKIELFATRGFRWPL